MAAVAARVAAAAGLLLIVFHLWLMAGSLKRVRAELEEKEKIRRLVTITLQNFADRRLLNEKEFWSLINRQEPMEDAWGTPYRLVKIELAGGEEVFWRSAGADRAFGTGDDLEVQVPYVDGPPREFAPLPAEQAPPAIDAK